jgi:hypothetical protein
MIHSYLNVYFKRGVVMKFKAVLGLIFLIGNSVNLVMADESVKVVVGTQTYRCELGAELNCHPVNEVQQKTILLKKNGGAVNVEDKPRNLSADLSTSLNNGLVVYDVTLCSGQSCSISTVTTDSTGTIDQVLSGQYNITQKSFDVLGFFISSHVGFINFSDKILASIKKMK